MSGFGCRGPKRRIHPPSEWLLPGSLLPGLFPMARQKQGLHSPLPADLKGLLYTKWFPDVFFFRNLASAFSCTFQMDMTLDIFSGNSICKFSLCWGFINLQGSTAIPCDFGWYLLQLTTSWKISSCPLFFCFFGFCNEFGPVAVWNQT